MKRQQQRHSAITIFYSYAHADEELRDQLAKHLSQLKHEGLITEWYDRQIFAGTEWEQAIDDHLETASIILLLISADFLDSTYCYDIEMERALERQQRGEARVIPIILRPCDWQRARFGKLQAAPHNGKAITTWDNQDEAFLVVATELRRVIEDYTGPQLTPVDQRNRTILLKRVRQIWIEGLLKQSLHKAAWIELNLQERPDALENPWRLTVQELGQAPRPLAAGVLLVQVYDEADGQVLLLGEPGAGKTTLLLELTRTLLERAERDTHLPLPVVFNLSTWTNKRLPLSDWMLAELFTKYQVPRKIGMTLLATNQIIPLLDGLDEVAEHAVAACVQAITDYYKGHLEKGPTPLVVCCRSKEYMDLTTRVPLQQAVSILPLSQEQIDQYLQQAGEQVDALRHALQYDRELNALVRQPLMLNIFTLAYQGATRADLPKKTIRKRARRAIFAGYGDRTRRAVFADYVERMLTRRGHLTQWKLEQVKRFHTFLAGQMHQQNITIFSVEGLQPDWLPVKQRHMYQLVGGLLCGLLCGLIVGLLLGLSDGLAFGLIFGLFDGLLGGLIVGLIIGRTAKIEPAETLTWSWKGFQSGLFVGLIVGLAAGLGGGLFGGLSGRQLTERSSLTPNKGIWLSGRSGLIVGLFSGLVGWLYSELFSELMFHGLGGGEPHVLLVFGLVVGLVIGLVRGLRAFVQHFILRFWLWRLRYLPWNLVSFLGEADKRLLLRKVGGGYIFVHRQLLDYFASLNQPVPSEIMSPADKTEGE